MIDLSIITVNYNAKEFLKECLKSVFQNIININFEIWLVNNASKDGSLEMVKNEFPKVEVIANETNIGFAWAVNQAIKKANWKVYYIPLARIIYYGGAAGVQLHAFKNPWYFHRGACLFYKNYLAPHYFFLTNFLYYSGVWLAFVLKLLSNLFRKEKTIGSKKPS